MSSMKNRKQRALRLEMLQARELMAVDFGGLIQSGPFAAQSLDGTANNVSNVEWGSTNEKFLRLAKAEYGDGMSSTAGQNRPSARLISNSLSDQGDADIISNRDLSAFVYVWGQFLDHDLTLTGSGSTESMLIPIPKGDTYFDPQGTGTATMKSFRSAFDAATGSSATNPREQVNQLSAWIDASMVYGTNQQTSDALRSFVGGKMKIAADGMLPLNNAVNFPNGTVPQGNTGQHAKDDELFAAGDARANENIALTSLHTVFVREHNRWAERISRANPKLSDQEIYLRARSMVIAEIQAITYNEWLPAILGSANLGRYTGYNPKINPGLSNEFSTAAFRFGHSLLGDDIEFFNEQGKEIAEPLALRDAFFNPKALQGKSIDSIFKYLSSDPSSEFDLTVVNGVRNFLFGPPGSGGFDLASLNIQRGRDHGLADYNDTRASLGMTRVRSFAEITKNRDVQLKLQQLYGSVDNVDLWIGLLAEDHLPDSSVGPTSARIIRDQFERLRSGDRFWYERSFQGPLLNELRSTKLSDVLKRNTSMQNLQSNVFVFSAGIEGAVFSDSNQDNRRQRNESALANWTVELVGSDNSVVSTSKTGRDGMYRFNVQNGIRTDDYLVRITKDPSGRTLAQPIERRGSITRGDQWIRGLDLPIRPAGSGQQIGGLMASGDSGINTSSSAVDQFFTEMEMKRRRGT